VLPKSPIRGANICRKNPIKPGAGAAHRNIKAFFKKYEGRIFIISNGFKDFIDLVVKPYGIESDHVLANTFTFDEDGWVTGYDRDNLLAYSKGKSKTLQALNLDGRKYVIGDAYTDFEMVEAGIAHKFFAFTENVLRENIIEKADHVTPSFDEFLYVNQMPRALSYPKNRIKALLLDGIHEKAGEAFEEEGYQVEVIEGNLTEEELAQRMKEVSILGVRSRTSITRKVLAQADRLMAVGAFSVRTNLIDLDACLSNGVIVFNAPYTNTRSQVELALGQIIMLMRRVPVYDRRMHEGQWRKFSESCYEIRGKKLGIVGYGHSGTQLSVLAEALGMDVYYFDHVEKPALGNATKCGSLKELLRKADVVSINVSSEPENAGFFDKKAFKSMRDGSFLVNISNGAAVDLPALAANLKSGKIAGAAIDVFPDEPYDDEAAFPSELMGLDNVILTPHICGNTVEAVENTAAFVSGRIIEYINTGSTSGSPNFPELQLPSLKKAHRLIHVHHNKPGILARINSTLAKHQINILGQYLNCRLT
jgi:D-3-phosphoglycerate dehydrogenase / 2-oxoglutarate reductase